MPVDNPTDWYIIKIRIFNDEGRTVTRETKQEMNVREVETIVENAIEDGFYYGEFDDPEGRVHIPPHRVLSVTVKRLAEVKGICLTE